MASSIVIRTAKKDYVCDCCGKIIKAGSEYLDKVTLNDGKCVRHERYHDECPKTHPMVKLMELITQSDNNELIVIRDTDDTKYNIIGIEVHYDYYEILTISWEGVSKRYAWSEVEQWRLPNGRTLEEVCK